MSQLKISVGELKELMDSFKKSGIASLELADGDFSLSLTAVGQTEVLPAAAPVIQTAAPAAADAPAEPPAGDIVTAPIVGTFYAAAAPDKPPYVTVGQRVEKGDVLFIIESMKLMNEVTSEHSGVVSRIFVENGQPVEFGQPILSIE